MISLCFIQCVISSLPPATVSVLISVSLFREEKIHLLTSKNLSIISQWEKRIEKEFLISVPSWYQIEKYPYLYIFTSLERMKISPIRSGLKIHISKGKMIYFLLFGFIINRCIYWERVLVNMIHFNKEFFDSRIFSEKSESAHILDFSVPSLGARRGRGDQWRDGRWRLAGPSWGRGRYRFSY